MKLEIAKLSLQLPLAESSVVRRLLTVTSPLYDVLDHTSHKFSVRIWSWQCVSVKISSVAELSPVYCCLVTLFSGLQLYLGAWYCDQITYHCHLNTASQVTFSLGRSFQKPLNPRAWFFGYFLGAFLVICWEPSDPPVWILRRRARLPILTRSSPTSQLRNRASLDCSSFIIVVFTFIWVKVTRTVPNHRPVFLVVLGQGPAWHRRPAESSLVLFFLRWILTLSAIQYRSSTKGLQSGFGYVWQKA